MRRGALVVGAALLLGAVAMAWVSLEGRQPASRPARPPAGILQVDELRTGPERFRGDVQVLGVVGGTQASEKRFGLVDTREVEACGTVTCPEFLLPVAWAGEMPAVGQVVAVRGRVEQSAAGVILVASKVEKR